jgi:hypothetical protein
MNERHRIAQLEKCLRDVLRWCSNREIELKARGRDNCDNEEYCELARLIRRVHRTLPPNAPFGLTTKST